MKWSLMFIVFCLSSKLYATDSVRISLPTALVVSGTTDVSFTLGSDSPSGEGTTEALAAKVYIPVKSNVTDQLKYSTLSVSAAATTLYDIGSTSHTISFPLLMTVGSTAKYLYMAVRGGASGTSYYVSQKTTSTYSSQTSALINYSITAKDICKSVIYNSSSSGITACNTTTGALDPTSTTNVLYKPMLYFFLSDQVIAVDGSTVIDPANANYAEGIYFEAQMSNRIWDSTAIVVSLDALKKGDKRLIGTFSASTTMDTAVFKKIIAYSYTDTTTTISTNEILGNASAGSILNKDLSTSQSGTFTLSGLTNGQAYNISIAFQDKFFFTTTLSTSLAGTPIEIQELLKKQACYILTAGFGEEHYVTNFFRVYRDSVLAHSWLGRKLIQLYYGSAPHYAAIIYQSEPMRFAVRMLAYAMYGIFNYFWVILFLLMALTIINKKNQRLKL